jgi:hypothetical protein
VSINARVYTPAVAQVNTTTVDFGIVHRGEAVGARNVSVTNSAPLAAPNDTLRGTISTASAPFSATGTLGDLAAQSTNASGLSVGLNTSAAGIFNGSAGVVFSSHNPDLSDKALGTSTVALLAQVNNFAEASFASVGAGTLTLSGHTYTLDFGTVQLGSGALTATLKVLNSALGPSDLLGGSFDLSSIGPGFTLSGFGSFAGLVAGAAQDGLTVVFGTAPAGLFESSLVLHANGSNASGFIGALADTTVVLRGSVVAVPEPGTWVLMFAGVLLVLRSAQRRVASDT